MAAITSSVGIISGINTGAIITGLLNLDSGPVSLLQSRVSSNSNLNATYQSLGSQLSTLQTTAQSLEQASTFQAASANSSNPSVLTATAANGAAVGNYSLRVAQLVTTQQLISTGFTDTDDSPIGAGTITIEEGGGNLQTKTPLSELNGGAGVGRGQFRITDRSGASSVIDTSSAVTLDDVVNDINTSTNISVRASIQNNHLVLSDTSGKTTSNLIVQDLGTGHSAANLGITANAASNSIAGTAINYISSNTLLAQLNDGRGLTLGTGGGDFNVKLTDGTNVAVNLATAKNVGDVIDAINTAGGSKLTASIPAGSTGIQLTDNTNGTGTTTITNIDGSQAAEGLGLSTGGNSKTITGKAVIASLDSTLLSSLNGGSGISLGSIRLTDRSGNSNVVNLSNANSVQDVLDDINNNGTAKVSASLKSSGNGIQITDTSGGTGDLTIVDAGTIGTAERLGINGVFGNDQASAQGADLKKQWVTDNTLLSSLNGGQGIGKSQFTVTNSTGASTTIDLSGTNVTTVGDLLYQINSKSLAGVTASINADGNGISLSDTSGGASQLTVKDVNGTAAQDLNIAGTATDNAIDGAYEKTITVTANDTLATVTKEINDLNFGVTATVINDGSSTAPYRLSLTADNSGSAGAVTVDTSSTNLDTQTLVEAQDAAVFVGSSGTTQQPLLITSSTNQVANVIQGVTLNLQGVSANPVQLNVSQDTTGIAKSLTDFVSTFNSLTGQISSQSTFNTSTNVAGLLLGDPVAASITSALYNSLNTVVGTGNVRVLAQLGITVGDGGQLTFDQDTFNQAIATDPDGVEQLFHASNTTTNASGGTVTTNTGVAYAIDNALKQLIDPISGSVTGSEKELTAESQGFTDQITSLNALLAQKKAQLEEQFNNMESVLANLQSQQSSLSSIGGASTTATKTAG